jgi:DNA-binding response OmpR family regulator
MQPLTDRKTLLLVEDDPVYAEFIISSLAKSGLPFNPRHIPTLDQALAYLRGEAPYHDRTAYPMPAVVLLDIILSAGSGFPILRWLQEHGKRDKEQTRVVMLTASNRSRDIQQALELGALSYLVKSPLADNVTSLLAKFAVR